MESCEDAVVEQLMELQQNVAELLSRDGDVAEEELFFAQQNARLVKDAEQYYRSMFRGRASSWNLRDRHMVETLANLVGHLNGSRQPKAIVWAHNSHLGDARATEMSHYGEVNVGRLIRERFGNEAVLIGLSTFHGSVTAASDWGAPAERKNVRPALEGSYEHLFHETGLPRFWIDLRGAGQIGVLQQRRIERAIGVIYRPQSERLSHYFHARLPEQFDAIIHINETRAIEPLGAHQRMGRRRIARNISVQSLVQIFTLTHPVTLTREKKRLRSRARTRSKDERSANSYRARSPLG